MNIYRVQAYRYGDRHSPSDFIGLFSSQEYAEHCADEHERYTGWKWECEITQHTLDDFDEKTRQAGAGVVVKQLND